MATHVVRTLTEFNYIRYRIYDLTSTSITEAFSFSPAKVKNRRMTFYRPRRASASNARYEQAPEELTFDYDDDLNMFGLLVYDVIDDMNLVNLNKLLLYDNFNYTLLKEVDIHKSCNTANMTGVDLHLDSEMFAIIVKGTNQTKSFIFGYQLEDEKSSPGPIHRSLRVERDADYVPD